MSGRALVTGANGFVGSAVVRALLRRGRAVRGFVRPGSDRGGLAGLDVERAEGDLRDGDSLRAALKGVEEAYFVAADYRLWVRDPAAMFAVNVDAAAQAVRLAAAAGVSRIVHTSSVAAIKPPRDRPGDETTPTDVRDLIGPYKKSKLLGERAALAAAAETGAPLVVVNPTTPVGPGDRKPTPTGAAVRACAEGRMPAYIDGDINVVHVDDVAEGHVLAAERGRIGERYILGGENMTLRAFFTAVAESAGRRPPRIRLPADLLWPAALWGEISGRLTGRTPMLSVDTLRMAKTPMRFCSAKAAGELGYAPRPATALFR